MATNFHTGVEWGVTGAFIPGSRAVKHGAGDLGLLGKRDLSELIADIVEGGLQVDAIVRIVEGRS